MTNSLWRRVSHREQAAAAAACRRRVGTWRGPGGATLTLRANGTFVARDLPEDLHYDAMADQSWSGSGMWPMAKFCGVSQPGICVAAYGGNTTTLQTRGSSYKPVLVYPDLGGWPGESLSK